MLHNNTGCKRRNRNPTEGPSTPTTIRMVRITSSCAILQHVEATTHHSTYKKHILTCLLWKGTSNVQRCTCASADVTVAYHVAFPDMAVLQGGKDMQQVRGHMASKGCQVGHPRAAACYPENERAHCSNVLLLLSSQVLLLASLTPQALSNPQ